MGKLVMAGVHPEGTPLGEFADAVWAIYVDFALAASPEAAEAIDEHWARLVGTTEPAPTPAAPVARSSDGQDQVGELGSRRRRRPTREEMLAWGSSPEAQAGAATLAGMAGASPGARGARSARERAPEDGQ